MFFFFFYLFLSFFLWLLFLFFLSKSIPIRRGFSYFLSSCFCFAPFPPFFIIISFFSPQSSYPHPPFPLYLLFFSLTSTRLAEQQHLSAHLPSLRFFSFFLRFITRSFPVFFSFPNFFFWRRLRERRSSKEEQKNNGEIQSYIKRRKNQLLAKRGKARRACVASALANLLGAPSKCSGSTMPSFLYPSRL